MISIGTVWDRTVDVIGGRLGILVSIAVVTLVLPTVARDAAGLTLGTGALGQGVRGVLGLVMAVLSIVGTLAMTAIASDPATDRAAAYRQAQGALGRTLLAVLVLLAVCLVLFVPGIVLLARTGFDFAAAARDLPQPKLDGGAAAGFAFYTIAYCVVAIWAGARLALLYPVLLNERAGLGAFRRSFALTRGLTLRIIGVIILYLIVVSVVYSAATSVVGLVVRLLLGPEQPGLVMFVTACVAALVAAGAGVLQTVFTARLYIAVRDAREGVAAA